MPNPKMFDLSGKVAVVAGGNGGIGRGIALGLAEAGASVAIFARTPAGRFAEPVAMSGAAVFLASQASNFVNGADIIVDGGFSFADKFPVSTAEF